MSRNTADIPHQQVTDHRILRKTAEANSAQPGVHVIPLLVPAVSARDLGLAYGFFADKSKFAHSEAVRLLQNARTKGEVDPIALTELGYLLKSEGRIDAASELFQQALLKDPRNVKAAIYLGQIYRGRGKLQQALALWKRAFELDPHLVSQIFLQTFNVIWETDSRQWERWSEHCNSILIPPNLDFAWLNCVIVEQPAEADSKGLQISVCDPVQKVKPEGNVRVTVLAPAIGCSS
jgi:tetratricopeptide (TPR) repeat protein